MVWDRKFETFSSLIIIGSKEDSNMSNSKFYVNLDTTERNLLLTCLNDLRNDLLSKGRHTDAVDELMPKIASAKQRKFTIR